MSVPESPRGYQHLRSGDDASDAKRAAFRGVARVVATAGPLLLAIAGSALTPLPCAFSMLGTNAGLLILALIAAANDYTTVIMVRVAVDTGTTGYEEVVLAACGKRFLYACRVALVLLLFGTLCGSLAAMRETAARTFELSGLTWLGVNPQGRTLLLIAMACAVLPLSLASLGEMTGVSLVGVGLMISVAVYVMVQVFETDSLRHLQSDYYLDWRPALLPQASSIFGYAFYVQPCALPMLRTLPSGPSGGQTLERALHLTFGITFVAYACVGLGGFLLYGHATPEDLLTSCTGATGALLTGIFCVYLILCFAPTLVPLREALVRLYLAQKGAHLTVDTPHIEVDLPPRDNAILTTAIILAALLVTVVLPQSEMLFSITGATGVCLIGYLFPVLVYWNHLTHGSKAHAHSPHGGELVFTHVNSPDGPRDLTAWLPYVAMVAVVGIGVTVSVFSLATTVSGLFADEPSFCRA